MKSKIYHLDIEYFIHKENVEKYLKELGAHIIDCDKIYKDENISQIKDKNYIIDKIKMHLALAIASEKQIIIIIDLSLFKIDLQKIFDFDGIISPFNEFLQIKTYDSITNINPTKKEIRNTIFSKNKTNNCLENNLLKGKSIFIICSKRFYPCLLDVVSSLKNYGANVILPNCFISPETESFYRNTEEHSSWKKKQFKKSIKEIEQIDAVLVFNQYEDTNYVGGATLLEMYEAFRQNKKVFTMFPYEDVSFKDELIALTDKILFGDISKIEI